MSSGLRKALSIVALVVVIFGALGYIGRALYRQRAAETFVPTPKVEPSYPEPVFHFRAHWDHDATTDVEALNEYQQAAGEALAREDFDELDRVADQDRAKKFRFAGGTWKLLELYRGLTRPLTRARATDKDWRQLIAHLETWTQKKPNSITSRVALADAWLGYAYYARGEDDISTVTQDGERLFKQRTATARQILEEAHRSSTEDPHLYLALLKVAIQQGWPDQEEAALFEKAIAYEPTYYAYYRERARYLQPKWYGEDGDMEAFAKKIADRIGGDEGDRVYFEIASGIACNCSNEHELKEMNWARIKRGYQKIQSKYGASLVKMNHMAYLATQNFDPMFAATLFPQIGENWDRDQWKYKRYYDEARNWTDKFLEPGGEYPIAVRANLKTPDGAKYASAVSAEFTRKNSPALNDCRRQVADQLRAFDIYAEVQENGTLAKLTPYPNNDFSNCVVPKVASATLAKPPRSAYWVRLPVPER